MWRLAPSGLFAIYRIECWILDAQLGRIIAFSEDPVLAGRLSLQRVLGWICPETFFRARRPAVEIVAVGRIRSSELDLAY